MPTEGDTLNGAIPHQSLSKGTSTNDDKRSSQDQPKESTEGEEVVSTDQRKLIADEEQRRLRKEHERVRANQHSCPHCGLLINSAESLHVHMQYQHEDMNRWGATGSVQSTTASTTSSGATTTTSSSITSNKKHSTGGTELPSTSPTDSENNNQPLSGKLPDPQQFLTPNANDKTSLNSLSNAPVSAAADSSDNQPATPQPSGPVVLGSATGNGTTGLETYSHSGSYQTTASGLPLLGQEMHPYPTYMHGYEQYYHPPPGMDYAAAQSAAALYASNQTSQPPPGNQEYKIVPSPRYHPYMNNASSLHPQHQQQHGAANGSASNNASSSASNSSLSPRVVSSSSPTQNAIIGQTQDSISSMQSAAEQAGGGGGPKVCDKCGLVCPSQAQLSEHYNAAHGTQPPNEAAINRSGDEQSLQTQYSSYQPYIKEEPPSDILDLDSQKMVYPPQHDGISQDPLPPMHSMHPMHRSLMWGAPDIHSGYISHCQPDMKPYYSPLKQTYPTIKQEYATGPGGFTGQTIKSEFGAHHPPVPQQTRDIKPFNTELASGGNPVTSSPSEFPSTTTPQENGGQFRGFEPPTSSLPSQTTSTKSATWKSNEARRPKTYNCTACNKWFTSSGHLKRHYNTTLHKNAVKSSGQPDPATLPISAHHHPARDPNSKHHHRNSQSNQPPPVPPEPPRSPEYQPQYTPPPNSFSQTPQGFQQYTTLQSSANGHPNGQAGPSVRASQQRGLLIISNTAVTSNLEEQEVQHLQHQASAEERYISLEQLAVQQQQQALQAAEREAEELQANNTSSNSLELHQSQQHLQEQHQHLPVHIISMSPQQIQQHMLAEQQQQHIISTMDTTPTTTIINTMDQQFIITSPLAINTNITQSYQPLQPQEEHQLNYHTITGNEEDTINLSDTESANNTLLQQFTAYGIQTQSQEPEIVTVQRLPCGGGGLVTYQDNMSLPYTPIVPESYLYATHVKCERSPEVGDVAPEMSPYSPTITSTKAALPSPAGHKRASSSGPTAKTPPVKRRKAQSDKKSLTTVSITSNNGDVSTTTSTTLTTMTTTPRPLASPTGEIRCDECNKVFTKICYLTQHNKTFHNGEQPFRCNRCGKRFSNEKVFDTHYAKHSALQKPHRCQFCPKQFHHKTDLRRHLDSHTGRKAYVCDTCSKGFTRRDHLRKHGDTHKPKPPKPVKIRTKLIAAA